MKRVVVTGIGSVSPLGSSFVRSWDALKEGRSGIGRIERFDASHLPWKTAGELKDFEAAAHLSRREIGRLDLFVRYAVTAAIMAAEDAGLIEQSAVSSRQSALDLHDSLSDAGVIIGSSRGGISTMEQALLGTRNSKLETRNLRLSPYFMPSTTISMAASYVAQRLGIRGYCLGISNACASGANAVGEAFRLIKSGHSRLVFAGGAEAPLCRLCIEGYGRSGVLSRQDMSTGAPRPFDRKRDGFVLSEGACVLILEEYESAIERGAAIYGEIIGYGNTTDCFHMTRPGPEGEAKAMIAAMEEGGTGPGEVDYINTHGTATRIGDIAEAQAIRLVFGKRASAIPATATKSMTGHMLAASGSFETASTLMSVREGIIPPTINLSEKDPECDIDIITDKREADIRIALSNSFGFGGVNAVLALKRIG